MTTLRYSALLLWPEKLDTKLNPIPGSWANNVRTDVGINLACSCSNSVETYSSSNHSKPAMRGERGTGYFTARKGNRDIIKLADNLNGCLIRRPVVFLVPVELTGGSHIVWSGAAWVGTEQWPDRGTTSPHGASRLVELSRPLSLVMLVAVVHEVLGNVSESAMNVEVLSCFSTDLFLGHEDPVPSCHLSPARLVAINAIHGSN
ncbi:hypothetical protein RRG08_048377 [Elysia crispata]|uniref:Uncharacterized protein n=1 Tax=Elysia crispata TaxID=231223 RepID=A0AAE1B9I2_9GAST|nr:hypothetical protein RRG08_048377 [Elysia crispata]